MAAWECRNSSCKSFGTAHPNCRCSQPMAEGGSIENYCDSDSAHGPDCEHFKQSDHNEEISKYLANAGFHGLLKMHADTSEAATNKYRTGKLKGHKKIHSSIEGVFSNEKSEPEDLENPRELINGWINRGGIDHDINDERHKLASEQNFSGGGEVKDLPKAILGHPMEKTHPEQNVLLNATKARVSNYLSDLKPQKFVPQAPFDDKPDQSQRQKSYDRATKIAANPLRVLEKIKKGTIEPEHIHHLNSMYPELNNHLQKKITEKILHAQIIGEKPNYKTRQGLSMFLGAPLSSEMNPANIQAAQAVFQIQSSSSQGGGGSAQSEKKSALQKTAQSYLTSDEASASRQQKQ